MGKIIVINGADFSSVAIGDIYSELRVSQGTINGSNGNWNFSDETYTPKRLKSAYDAGIELGIGDSIKLVGVKGLGIGYFVYDNNEPIPANCLLSQCINVPTKNEAGNNEFTYTNETGQAIYIWFIFKWNGTDGIHQNNANISPTDVDIKYI